MQIVLEKEIIPNYIDVSEHEEIQVSLRYGIESSTFSNIELDLIQVRLYSELHRIQDECTAILNELKLFLQKKRMQSSIH